MNDELPRRIEVSIELDPHVHYAMQQNDVPVVKTLRIENRTAETLRDLEVRLVAEPAFASGWSARVASVDAESTYHIAPVDLELSPGYLAALTERVRGRLSAQVSTGGESVAHCTAPLEVLARDEWAGLSSLPEILSAFVMPNHPAAERVLRSAADLLGSWTGDPSLSGYQSGDRQRVYMMAGAVYGALQKLGITYVSPPASFENEGQRVRLPDHILDSQMATCLDVALLAAGCLEQAGLNALVVLVQGHAFTGVWLTDECFAEPAMDDGLRLRKRVDLKEIAVFDPTGVTARPALGFERAVVEAKRRLAAEDTFLCAVDVQRARKGRIRPLPETVVRPTGDRDESSGAALEGMPSAPDISGFTVSAQRDPAEAAPTPETPATRLDRWRSKLLDLSLRNRLLNFRDTKKSLPLLCPDVARLEDMLAGGVTFQVLSRPEDLQDGDPRDAAAHQRRTGQEALDELLLEELKSRRLRANTTPEELDRRMTEIYRAARLGLEEGGSSALYLAVGFLSWYETEKSEKARLAPILLLPLEVHRKSVRDGFTLRLADDDPRINVTLLELLKKDQGLVIPGLDPLPEDESGVDVPLILRTVRQAVRDIDRWDVLDEARIGFFSFTKFLMWRDLDERAEDLMKNPVVQHLVNRPDQEFDPDGVFPSPERLDEEHAPTETFCPLPADSSQLAAVFAAATGRSFVLEGPPGTGKSQTITNLIAHCLTEGKTILFVSEKMAALNVVHRRLESVGLGRYCLELHSNKAHKREVIGQLDESLQRLQPHNDEEWEREARRLGELRKDLNAYVDALHRIRTTGETVFQATSRLIGLREAHRVDIRWPTVDALDADQLVELRDLVERLATAGETCGVVRGHAWEGVQHASWTPGWDEEVRTAIGSLGSATETLADCAQACSTRLGLGESGWSLGDLEVIRELTLAMMASPGSPPALVAHPDWEEIQGRLRSWTEAGTSRDELRSTLREKFQDSIVELDLEDLRARLRRSEASWWPASWLRRRFVRRALRSASIDGKAPPKQELSSVLERALTLRKDQELIDAGADEARGLLGRHWNNGEAEWDQVETIRDWARTMRDLARRAAGEEFERAAALREKWARMASEGRDLLQRDSAIGREFVAYGEALEAFKSTRLHVAELLDLEVAHVWGGSGAPDAIGLVRSSVATWRQSTPQLRNWCAWRLARAEAMRSGLAPLVDAYERGAFGTTELRPTFERSFTQWWVWAVVDSEPVLSQFFSPEHERKIEQFRSIDDRYMELTRFKVQARLGERVPATSATVVSNSEMGILKREVAKKRRHMSVRKLLHRIPNLLPVLKPCLLMSPMSVAQYLDAAYPPFDVVVFDEASQIPVWDAVGAIARGKQAVIVGDPKQLPPTSFFQRAEDDEEEAEENVVEDLESILDDCMGARIPLLHLNWHYRSRHESLITFSNYHYYGNRLLTFPSSAIDGLGVSWRHVADGVYDKGKTRTNRQEADTVVAEILRRVRDPQLARYSIGVVTFSQAQQTLIEDLLDAARSQDPELEAFFAEDSEEPIFVKNLENVQGDERDVILFSICYGPDSLGRVSMNFGPMNREGGERRLNVAITRARREVVVFSTLKADQIDLSRTRARGVRDLKGFLEYADRGPSAIAEAIQPDPDADFDSPFEEAVYDALVDRGWLVHKQVGCARYRIDLAVVDPELPGRYLLGVECDGANYHRAKTARDRDKLREGVLRDLGWNLHRIWSTDWWTDAEREIEKLQTALEESQAAKASTPEPPIQAASAARFASQPAAEPIDEPRPTPPAAAQAIELERYRPALGPSPLGSQSDFYEIGANSAIRGQLANVVEAEGPISLTLAARRVTSSWGFERVRDRALHRVLELIPRDRVRLKATNDATFLWPISMEPDTYQSFRVPDVDGTGARSADELPPQEIANAMLHILRLQISVPAEDLVRETARLFGFQRMGRIVEERIMAGLDLLRSRGRVTDRGGNVVAVR